MKGFFIAGTDTGVGKTALAAALLCAARARGIDAVPMKPVQTGCTRTDGRLDAPDLDLCLRLAGMTPPDEDLDRMAPFRFEPACSPHLAAELSGRTIAPEQVLQAFRDLARRHEAVIVEGAGGVLVPIDRRRTMLDLMTALDLPVVIAARPGLGTLNHTLLCARTLRQAGLQLAGIVLVESAPTAWDFIERDNRETLNRFDGLKVLGVLPHVAGFGTADLARNRFRRAVLGAAQSMLDTAGW